MASTNQSTPAFDPVAYMQLRWEIAHPTWKAAIGPIGEAPGVREIGRLILNTPVNKRVPLMPDDLFRWATFPFDQIKVAIVDGAQDDTPGWAIGLGMSRNAAYAHNPEIVILVSVATAAVGYPRLAISNNLTPWAEQGVCLLSVFGSCTAHFGPHFCDDFDDDMDQPWAKFSAHIVRTLAEKRPHVVFLTMGLWPRRLAASLQLDQASAHAVVHAGEVLGPAAAGPDGVELAPVMRAGENVFWRVNQWLAEWGLKKVNWAADGLAGKVIDDGEYRQRTDRAIFAHRAQLGLPEPSGTAEEEDDEDEDTWEELDGFAADEYYAD